MIDYKPCSDRLTIARVKTQLIVSIKYDFFN